MLGLPAAIIGVIITCIIHGAVLSGLVRLLNGDDLDMETAAYTVVISLAIGVGFYFAVRYFDLNFGIQLFLSVPLACLIGLVVALTTGIPVSRAFGVGALYVVFLNSWLVCLAIVSVLVIREAYQHKQYARSRQALKERLGQRSMPDDPRSNIED